MLRSATADLASLIEKGKPINRGQVAQILKTASGGGAPFPGHIEALSWALSEHGDGAAELLRGLLDGLDTAIREHDAAKQMGVERSAATSRRIPSELRRLVLAAADGDHGVLAEQTSPRGTVTPRPPRPLGRGGQGRDVISHSQILDHAGPLVDGPGPGTAASSTATENCPG
ncbi:hypothetical protein [Streptomyces sp. NPDC046821]|uniref:hypothetical protein n=1 Tax=Streptomyces sp. NPDC046821 TaxID=3154702 RepID=UPI0033CB0788